MRVVIKDTLALACLSANGSENQKGGFHID
jgi:hypothetical protein